MLVRLLRSPSAGLLEKIAPPRAAVLISKVPKLAVKSEASEKIAPPDPSAWLNEKADLVMMTPFASFIREIAPPSRTARLLIKYESSIMTNPPLVSDKSFSA